MDELLADFVAETREMLEALYADEPAGASAGGATGGACHLSAR